MAITLDSIRTALMGPPRLVFYGPEGIGKSTLAAQMPSPVFLSAEEGAPNGVAEIHVQSYADVLDSIIMLCEQPHGFRTLVLDSATKIEPWLWGHVVATVPNEKGATMKEIHGYGFHKGFDHAAAEWGTLLAAMSYLRTTRGMAIAIIAHSGVERVENPETDPYDRFAPKLQKKASSLICEWADAVFLLSPKVAAVAAGESKGGDERKRAVGDGSATIYATGRPAWVAKNRYKLPVAGIPMIRDKPAETWAPIQKAIDAMTQPIQPTSPVPSTVPPTNN